MRKFLTILFMTLLAYAVGYDVGWAATATLPNTQALTETATYVGNDTHIKIKTSSANSYTNPLRIYANTTITITADEGYYIQSITYEASSTGNYVTNAQNAAVSPNVTPSVSGKNITWSFSGNVSEFTFSPSAQTRANSITITYEQGGSTPQTPELVVDPQEVKINANVGETATATFSVLGTDLKGGVTLMLADESSYFEIKSTTIAKADAEEGAVITVTYSPKVAGEHTATVTISSEDAEDVTVELSGRGVIAPVLADAAYVTSESFKAVWTVDTPEAEANVSSYTLYVNKYVAPTTQLVNDVLNRATTGVTTGNSYTEWSGKTGASGAVYAGQSAGGNESIQLRSNNNNSGIITTSSPGKIKKVTVNWNSNTASDRTLNVYGKNSAYSAATDLYGDSKGTLLGTIVKGTSTELTIDGDYEYVGVRSDDGAMYLTDITFTWEVTASSSGAPRLKDVEKSGDADDDGLVVTGITAKEYTVTDLTAGETYEFYVEANYSDGTKAKSNKKKVTLPDNAPSLTVNPASLTFEEQYTGVSTQKMFSVRGANLSGNVTLSVSGAYFTVKPTTLTPTDGTLEATTVTVTYTPTVADTHNATITISSDGVEDVTVELSGSAVLKKVVPVMSVADTETEVGDTWFDATWTDETPVANVSSYTLYVNKVEETPEPIETTIYEKVTDATTLAAGDKLIFVDETKNKAGGAIDANNNGSWLTAVDVTINNNKINIENVAVNVLTLEGEADNWTFKTSDGNYLTCTAAKFVKLGNTGTATSIAISDGDATISFGSTAGRILYNANSPRFTTYTSELTVSMRLPQIYRVTYTTSSGAPRLRATETGDASTRTITGISGDTKTYCVKGLTPGAKYDYQVKAVYVDEASALSNVEQVELKTLTPHTLAGMVADTKLVVGASCAIADGDLLAVALSADRKTLFCKDANRYADPQIASDGQVDYMAECGFGEYDQSNWVALTSESELSEEDLVGHYLSGVSGTLSNLTNPSLALTSAPTADDSGNTYTLNRFIPTSFMNEVVSGDKTFFFVTPKPMEVAIVTWACWDGDNEKFVAVPKGTYTKEEDGHEVTINPYDLQGEFTVNTKYLENWTVKNDSVYEFTAVITREGGASSAPGRLKSETSASYGIYPLSAPKCIGGVSGGTVTGITGVNGNGAAVKSVRVYNVAGVEQRELQPGVNIVVTTYTDGTRSTAKVLR